MTKSWKPLATLVLATALLAGCGQSPIGAPAAARMAAMQAAAASVPPQVRAEIKDAIEDQGVSALYEVTKLTVKPTQQRNVFAFTARARKQVDGDFVNMVITGTWNSKTQELESEEEEED